MENKRLTRGRAIRLKCLDCCCGSAPEVRLCHITKCPLWIYRMGREVTPEYPSEVKNDEDANDLDTNF